jgi:hypothetical protein
MVVVVVLAAKGLGWRSGVLDPDDTTSSREVAVVNDTTTRVGLRDPLSSPAPIARLIFFAAVEL